MPSTLPWLSSTTTLLLVNPIPLRGVDYGFGPKTPDGTQHVDGGIAGNFPLNLFDRPRPSPICASRHISEGIV